MRRDASEIVSERLNDLLWRLQLEVKDCSLSRRLAFDEIVDVYRGNDIVEVICREAEFLTLLSFREGRYYHSDDARVTNAFYAALPETAAKYAESANWPEAETKRARHFFLQLVEHSARGID